MGSKKLQITQIRSTIGRLKNKRLTIKALGIKKIGHSVVHEDTPTVRGMINTVKELIRVQEIEGDR